MIYKNDKNPKILDKFLNYLQGVGGCSINTIKAYNSNLLEFFTFIKEYSQIAVAVKEFNIFILLQVKESDIFAYLIYLNYTKNNNPYTRKRKLTAIRSFFRWLMSTYPIAYAKVNPAKNIPYIQKLQRIPKYLTLEQAKKIQTIFTIENSKFPLRNNTIISLFLSTGMRASELINIDLKDINFNKNSIRIIGKNNKERVVYMNSYCKSQIKKYITKRTKDKTTINLDEPLFINYQKKRVGIDCVENIVEKAYKIMGLNNMGYTTHTLRHTAATIMYTNVTQDILIIKEFLGHEAIESTQIYTHVYNRKIKEAVDSNPLNNYTIKKAA